MRGKNLTILAGIFGIAVMLSSCSPAHIGITEGTGGNTQEPKATTTCSGFSYYGTCMDKGTTSSGSLCLKNGSDCLPLQKLTISLFPGVDPTQKGKNIAGFVLYYDQKTDIPDKVYFLSPSTQLPAVVNSLMKGYTVKASVKAEKADGIPYISGVADLEGPEIFPVFVVPAAPTGITGWDVLLEAKKLRVPQPTTCNGGFSLHINDPQGGVPTELPDYQFSCFQLKDSNYSLAATYPGSAVSSKYQYISSVAVSSPSTITFNYIGKVYALLAVVAKVQLKNDEIVNYYLPFTDLNRWSNLGQAYFEAAKFTNSISVPVMLIFSQFDIDPATAVVVEMQPGETIGLADHDIKLNTLP